MRKKNLVIIAVASAFVLVAGAAIAFPGDGDGKRPMRQGRMEKMFPHQIERLCDAIGATDEQCALAHEVKDKLFESGKAIHEQGRDSRKQMLEIFKQDSPDVAAMRSIVDADLEQKKAFAYEAIDAALEVHAVLTVEQRETLADVLPEMGPRHRKGRFGKRGPCPEQDQ